MNADRLYFDHAAATPLHPEARDAMVAAFDCWANPNSPYAEARACNALLEQARRTVNRCLDWPHDLLFTAGASEAIALAAARCKLPGRIHGATEHDIVPASMGPDSIKLPVDEHGAIDRTALAEALAQGPALVAIQLVNNETGVIQDIVPIAEQVRAAGSLLLVDAAQGGGKIDLPDADMIALSAHKLGGPVGVGALLVKDLATLAPVGGQEKGYRRGTQNVPAAAGFAAALEAARYAQAYPRLKVLREQLDAAIEARGGVVIAKAAPRTATIGGYAFPGAEAPSLLVQLDLAGVAVSAGSACSSGAMKGSRVIGEMGLPEPIRKSFLRISFGPETSDADVDALLERLDNVLARSRAA
ncbi:cysteine desulfurase family protein [Sphingomicrobium astaxanthinifaciens]|uniref:cysteine desulfurase family protein n=1 Tax=Sphingomicrobium astaxanthinifaciens TaxID=1227949 RepID=UPI001FCBB3BB|nr:aminotransferase class V-fold PLP-dependent enzyme [Sphingomicrobium astaxanthinifaciens]MCJ7422365.1 aminotransferase class V-fold PLP-dependent enzyme [Sphingomicrobium astaxanthinifaciens]